MYWFDSKLYMSNILFMNTIIKCPLISIDMSIDIYVLSIILNLTIFLNWFKWITIVLYNSLFLQIKKVYFNL